MLARTINIVWRRTCGITLRLRTPVLAALVTTLLWASVSYGVETKVLRDETIADFNQGESTGTEILSTGKLRIGPLPRRLMRSDDAIAWKVALDRYDANMFVATGHDGKVWRVEPNGKTELWADLEEVEVTAITVDLTGGVLVGASPGGRIYRVVEAGKPRLFFETKEQHVWDLIFDRNGVLYVATGPNGKIFRVRGEQNGELYYDSEATNVMGLGFDSEGNLLAATQGKAMVLRISKPNAAYVLYSATEDECRSLTVDNNGNIYVAVNSARLSSLFDRLGADKTAQSQTQNTSSASATTRPAGGEVREIVAGMTSALASLSGQSFVVQIQPSGFVMNFWNAVESPIHSILAAPDGNGVFVAAGKKGKIYRLFTDSNYSLVADVEEQSVLSFTSHNGRVFFTTANRAALYELSDASTSESLFASRPLNGNSTVAWGNLMINANVPEGTSFSVDTRTGNTADPFDATWSEWAEATRLDDQLFRPKKAVAQYLQYRLRLRTAKKSASPQIDSVQVFYVQRNAPPILRDIRVEKVGGESAPLPAATPTPAASPRTGEAPAQPSRQDSGDAAKSSAGAALWAMIAGRDSSAMGGAPSAARVGAEQNSARFNVTWDATDPNGDRLIYRIALKAEDETEWRWIEKELSANRITIGTENLADGLYRVQVEATDRLQNPDDQLATATLVSNVFVVDNSPPTIRVTSVKQVAPNKWELAASASDSLSMISAAAFNVDTAKEWRALSPTDGIFDDKTEEFRFVVEPDEQTKEHVVRLRVTDREGNTKVEKTILRPNGSR